MKIVDSHQHYWDWGALGFMPDFPDNISMLKEVHSPERAEKEMKKVGVHYAIQICGNPCNFEKHKWFFRIVDNDDHVIGVSGWTDMTQPEITKKQLDMLRKEKKFCGVRHIMDLEEDIDWMIQKPVLESFKVLEGREIPFDMCIDERHINNFLKVLDYAPKLRVVLDHMGKPQIKNGKLKEWERGLKKIADRKNVLCKLSGFLFESNWDSWKQEDIAPYIQTAHSLFGDDRVMFGSNWPVCRVAGEYIDVWDTLNSALGYLDDVQRSKIFGENAIRFYELKV